MKKYISILLFFVISVTNAVSQQIKFSTLPSSGTLVSEQVGNEISKHVLKFSKDTLFSQSNLHKDTSVIEDHQGRLSQSTGINNPLPGEINQEVQAVICCPEFKLTSNSIRPCDDKACQTDHYEPNGGAPDVQAIIACKNQAQQYIVVPNLPGFTYSWTVLGGSVVITPANPGIINWGNAPTGYIQVIITNADGSCRDTIRTKVCLIDGPTAGITFSPNPVCAGSPVTFSGTSSVGATTYYWDFGDGSSSILQNPLPHVYSTGGSYSVVLTVSNSVVGGGSAGNSKECGCKDTAMVKVIVLNKKGIDIHTDDCRKMLCTGDTVVYCTNNTGCSGLNWVINGGTIISGQGTTCATVVWNQPSVYPTTVTLNGTCPGACGNSATIAVPILYPNLPIQGPQIVCPGTNTSYSLPALSGTFYNWTITGGGTIAAYDSNHNVISINWGFTPGGMHIITCNYTNPYSGCSGTDTIGVYIRPPFNLIGPSPVCVTQTTNYFTNGPAGSWTFTPNVGFTNTPIGTSQQQIVWNVVGNYSITAYPATAANFCTDSATFNVVVNPIPVLNPILGNSIICPNQLYDYSVSSNISGGSFTWSFASGAGIISPYGVGNSSASIQFTGAGPWVLLASQTVSGCTGSQTLSVTKVPAPPSITLVPSGSICSGGTITASVTGAIPPGGYTWSSTPGATLTAGQGTLSATFTVNSNATITLTSCGGTSTAAVTTSATVVTISQVAGTCSATLTASPGGGTYNWFLDGNPAGSGNPITVTQNGTYVVQANYGGCIGTSQITITGITPVVATISATGNLCTGVVTLQAPIPANCPGATFTWSNGAIGNPITVSTPGSYYVTVTCSNGCSDVSNIINVIPCASGPGCIPDATISGNNNCSNPVNLTATAPGCTPTSYAWYYGDGFAGPTGTHLYANPGSYQVYVVITCANGTVHCTTQIVTVPMVDSFTSVISCGANLWNIQLQDASLYLPAYAGYSLLWTTTCGTLSANNIPNPVLTVPFGCNPTVTFTISKSGCTLTKSFTFGFPNTALSIVGPDTVCAGVNNSFSSNFTTGVLTYNWQFGDATSGVTNPIVHAYDGSPPNPTMTMAIMDQFGCVFTATKPITVNLPTPLNITPAPLIKICPDCSPPVTLNTNPAASFTGFQWYQNGAAISGANNSTYQLCNFNASGNYFVSAISNSNGCPVISDTVQVVYQPKPVAVITGQTVQCVSGSSPYTLYLQNAVSDPNYTYVWTANGPGTVTFSPDAFQFYASASVTQLGNYEFILTVTDTSTGCSVSDTFCLFVYLSPSVTVSAPSSLCEGTMSTMTANATPPNPNYLYLWSNGANTQSITTAQAGTYIVTVTDPLSGCTAAAFAGTIKKRPYVDLFPQGCDILCDTTILIPPLPLVLGQTYAGVYNIKWYVDGSYHSTGVVLNLSGLSLGLHKIYIVVNFLGDTCTSTSGTYDLFIKHCGDCDCENSSFEEIILGFKNEQQVLECNDSYKLKCNEPYSIKAGFKCSDTACESKVTYSLLLPDNSIQTGNVAFSFTPVQNVTYVLTLYGWCGSTKCDSCVIKFDVKCKDCGCKGSKWGKKSLTIGNVTQAFKCIQQDNIPVIVKCKTPINLNANYNCTDAACPGAVTYSLTQPSGTTTGSVPLSFTPSVTGSYSVTLYGWCGNTKCDSCTVIFKTECQEDTTCCPYEIKVESDKPMYDYIKIPKATLATNIFTINGLSTAAITEVRAHVVSYTVTDNFDKECMKCVNLPFTWASISSVGNIGSVPGNITVFGGSTTPSFIGSGSGVYQNPREVIWNNGSTFGIPNGSNVVINFILPPVPAIVCCELKGKICVKFTFRDNQCKECEVIKCFEYVIHP